MAEQTRRRVPLVLIVAGGLILGAGLFGMFRGMRAEPLPDTLPVPKIDLPAVGDPLPVPALPPVDPLPIPKVDLPPVPAPVAPLPVPAPVEPTGGFVPPVPLPLVPKPAPEPTATPKLDPVPLPKVDPLPPVRELVPIPQPKLDPVPVPKVDPLPLPPVPSDPPRLTDVRPAGPKPDSGLRSEVPVPSLTPGPLPGPEVLPLPRKVGDELLPPPKPVVEEIATPGPVPPLPGAAPMTLTPRTAMLTALMGSAMAAAPLVADEPKPADNTKAFEAIQKQIDDLKKDVTDLKAQKKALEDKVSKLTPTDPQPSAAVLKRLDDAEKASKAMAFQIRELEDKLAQKTTSEKQPLPDVIPAGKAVVAVVNEYGVKVSMRVNGTSHSVDIGQTKRIEVPAGALEYELVEFPNFTPRKTDIKEGETITLRVK